MTTITEAKLAEIVEVLGSVRQRPAMYFGRVAVEPANCWLHGFEFALRTFLSFESILDAREQAVTARGWTWSAALPSDEMTERGLTPAEVVDELLAVEIEVVRLLGGPRRAGPDRVR